jgi:thermopsin
MSVVRSNWGLAVLVTFVMLVSSMGIAGAAAASRPTSTAVALPANAPPANQVTPRGPAVPATETRTVAHLTTDAPSSPTSPPTALPTPSGRMSSLVAALNQRHVPIKDAFLPNLNAQPDPSLVGGHVVPGYSAAPAPLGVADYGLQNSSGTITPYTLATTSLEGTYTPYEVTGLSQDISGPDEYGVQLNAVLNNVTLFGNSTYQFWTQNVIEYSTYSSELYFVSNIWNFSGGPLGANTFYQVGPNGTVAAPELYYGVGGPIQVTYPFTLNLFLNSTLENGRDAVYFNFSLDSGTGFFAGSYDFAVFNSTVVGGPVTPVPEYVANGFSYNPIGLPDDFEMVMGGPGGGSNFDALNAHANFGLQYLNSTDSYTSVPSAYGYGSETGETTVGATVLWGNSGGGPGGNLGAFLTTGPAFLTGLWNVSAPIVEVPGWYGGDIILDLSPSNAFVFIAQGNVFNGWYSTNWSLFQWAPYDGNTWAYELAPGTYTVVGVAANYDPAETLVSIPATGTFTSAPLTLTFDDAQGVYTPLWALNNSAVANISNSDGSDYILFNQQYGPLGTGATFNPFPWFGAVNDYLFPVFPGIYLNGTSVPVIVFSPPSLKVNYPAPIAAELGAGGLPTWNNLQLLFDNVSNVYLENGANIGGWWYAGAYFGSAVSAYNVVFWNATLCEVFQNTFTTGGKALYFYGGTHNLVANNTFEQSVPVSPDPYASVAGAYGSTGIFEADYGNASDVALQLGQANATAYCFVSFGYCDVIFNNIFLTTFTADSPLADPYSFYGYNPTCPAYLGLPYTDCYFDNAWNIVPTLAPNWATNIIGGPTLGGNYWWDYGTVNNPYNLIPYDAYSNGQFIFWYGDYLPLTPFSLYTVTFEESGLPSGTVWSPSSEIDGVYQYYYSDTTTANLSAPSGSYTYTVDSFDPQFAAAGGTFTVVGSTVVVLVEFVRAYQITFTETGLPTGTYWWVDVYDASTGDYVGGSESTNATVIATGFLPGAYTYAPGSDAEWVGASPTVGSVTVAGNMSVAVTFAPIHVLTVNATGLAAGASWTLLIWNSSFAYTWITTGSSLTFSDIPGSYNWATASVGYTATPSQGTFTLGTNETQTIRFGTPSTVTFSEVGLTDGAAWTVTLTQFGVTTNYTGVGSSIVIDALVGAYNYSVGAAGYLPTTPGGSGALPSDNAVSVTFTATPGAPGTLALTVTTSGATATVNGKVVTTPFSQPEAPGNYAIVVSASGYLPYYNNVTVSSGQTSTVTVTLVATSGASGTSSTSGISTTAWALIGLLGVLALIFLITTILFARRGRSPPSAPAAAPPPTGGAPPATGGAAPSGAPAWSEGPSPPSPPPGAT